MDNPQLAAPLHIPWYVFLIVMAGVGACLGVWTYVLSRWVSRRPAVPYEPRRPVPWTVVEVLLTLLAWMLFVTAAGVILRVTMGQRPGRDIDAADPQYLMTALLINSLANLAACGAAAVLITLRTRASRADWGFDPAKLGYDLWLGVLSFVAIAPPIYILQYILVQWFPSEHPLMKLLLKDQRWEVFALAGLMAVIVAPLAEEFFFRLFLQGWLEAVAARRHRKKSSSLSSQVPSAEPVILDDAASRPASSFDNEGNPFASPQTSPVITQSSLPFDSIDQAPPVWWPVWTSAVIFALLHLQISEKGPNPDPVPLLLLALCLGYLYRQTHRIVPSIVVHLLLNGSSLLLFLISSS